MRVFVFSVCLSAFLLSQLAIVRVAGEDDITLYTDIKRVNRTESLIRLKSLPIVYYKFLYDNIPDRIQLGVVGPDAQRLFPESIDVLPSTSFISNVKDSNSSSSPTSMTRVTTTVTNFPIVDKNVLYMHGLAAIQELITEIEHLEDALQNIERHSTDYKVEYEDLQKHLQGEIDRQLLDQLDMGRLEVEQKQKELALEDLRQQQEKDKLKLQLEEEKKLLEYEEQLSKERLLQQEEITRKNLEKQLSLEKEVVEKKELLQKKNQEKAQLLKDSFNKDLETKKLEYEKERIRIEMESKAKQEKLNEEIALRKIQAQSKLDTERMVEGIKNVSSQIALLVRNIFAHPQQLLFLAGIILGLITGYFFIREVSNLIRQFIQANIGKPVLVRETSYHFSLFPSFLSLDSIFPNRMNNPDYLSASLKQLEEEFLDIILGKDDKSRVINLALATRNTKRSGAPYRHVLLHGEPGTGKTLVARKLAQCSGMDYAILSGGDVAPLGEDAVTQLHSLFRWAKRSKKGLLVFIDEAEAFLSSRSHIFGESGVSDTHTRNALNALLYQTGTPSTNFMMILATNRPEDLDSAILDRIDVSIQISLPKLEERKDLVKLYMKLHLKQVIAQRQFRSSFFQFFLRILRMGDFHYKLDEKCDHEDNLNLIARRIEGFSGREISKMFISAQYAMFLAPNRYLSWELLEDVVKTKIKEHLVKVNGFRSVVAADAKSALK